MAHLVLLGYLFADSRLICFGSNSCTPVARRGGHISGNVLPLAVPDTTKMSLPGVMWESGMASRTAPSVPPDEPGSGALSLCGVEVQP